MPYQPSAPPCSALFLLISDCRFNPFVAQAMRLSSTMLEEFVGATEPVFTATDWIELPRFPPPSRAMVSGTQREVEGIAGMANVSTGDAPATSEQSVTVHWLALIAAL